MSKKRFLTLPTLPHSTGEQLEITSADTGLYNCVAWAMGMTDVNYWPKKDPNLYWPSDLPMAVTTENFLLFFKKYGFGPCENGNPEKGFEKIVLFEKDGLPTHAARLLKNGSWTSKLGILEDVRHSLSAISGGMYGEPGVFMKRPL